MVRVSRRDVSKRSSEPLDRKITILMGLVGAQLLVMIILLIVVATKGPVAGKPAKPAKMKAVAESAEVYDDGEVEPSIETREAGDLPPEVALERPVRIEILNGCGVTGLASRYGEKLKPEGYDVRDKRNASRSNYANSFIFDRTALPGQAKRLAMLLGIPDSRVIEQADDQLVDIDLTLILGADYEQLQ